MTALAVFVGVATVAEVLLAPLSLANRVVPGLQTPGGHLEIDATSVRFGALAVAVMWLWRRRRRHAERPHRPGARPAWNRARPASWPAPR